MLEVKTFPKDTSVFDVVQEDPRRCFFSGLFEESVEVNGVSRSFYTYLKPNLHYNQPCVVVAAPEGVSGPEYLEQSHWLQFAEEQDVFLFLAVPKDGKWNLDGTDGDYINQLFVQANARRYYVTMQDNFYVFGVGAGSTAVHQAAIRLSSHWSGLATFGDLHEEVLQRSTAPQRTGNNGATELFVSAAQVQLPVWMSWTENAGVNADVCAYWKAANDADEECFSNRWADEIYFPGRVVKTSQVNEEKIAQVRVTNGFSGEPELARIRAVWEYLHLACRHRGFGTKHLRTRIDPKEYGFTYHTMTCDGFVRCWYEYVPQKVKDSGEAAPVVVCMHGRGGTAETFISLSGMSRVAEERSFIVLFPEAGVFQQRPGTLRNLLVWSGNYKGKPTDDVGFILRMLEDVKLRNRVDPSRIYACGQSSGGMMTHTLAMKAPGVFAAVAPWSALVKPEDTLELPETIEPAIPYMFLFGDEDFLCSDVENGQLPYRVTELIASVLKNLIRVYGLNETPASYRVGEITYYVYRNAKGTPMLTVGRVKDMPHANYPRESWISYDEFLSKFSRRDDGTLLYMGEEAI